MSPLRAALEDYLRIRRSLGFKLEIDGRMLEDFIAFLERAGAIWVTTELALDWAKLPRDAHPYHWRKRLGVVRLFARYLATIDPGPRSPPRICCPPLVGGWRRISIGCGSSEGGRFLRRRAGFRLRRSVIGGRDRVLG